MPTAEHPYVNTQPGDLITAQLFNGLQSTIKQDIADQIKKAVEAIKNVDLSGDSAKLGGKTPKELEDEIIQKALAILPTRTGYRMIFKRLAHDDEKVIKHELKACPLVDVYQLDYFPVICATGDEKEDRADARVNFYLYHSTEKKFKSLATGTTPPTFEIEPTDGKHHPFKIPFATMLHLFDVKYTDTSSLDDLETEFWKALFSGLNDEFDEDQYCHSPWFEKCCGEQRSVATLKSRGDWDDLWFQMRPRKVVHFLVSPTPDGTIPPLSAVPSALADVQVVHFDFDTIGVQLLNDPFYPNPLTPPAPPPISNTKELKVMLLLKV
jgi:hypothetical protein